jgi:hypothetical protein
MLAALSHTDSHSPVLRGIFVLERLLCQPPPPPPPNVPSLPSYDPNQPRTTRQRFEELHEADPVCASCHKAIDGAGFTMENYDAIGRYRTDELGLLINSASELVGTDVDGPVADVLEMSARLSHSRTVETCVTEQLLRYGFGVGPESVTAIQRDTLAFAFRQANGRFDELFVQFVKSAPFRHRTVE